MIKVFEVSADTSLSGAPKHILTLLQGLDKSIFQPTLVCPEGWLQREAKKLGVKVYVVPFGGFLDRKSVGRLRRLVKEHRPQIVHLHGVRTGWLGALACRKQGTKMIYSEHLYTADYHLESKVRERIQLLGLSYVLKKAKKVIVPSGAVKSFLIKCFKVKNKKIKVIYNGLPDLRKKPQQLLFEAPDAKSGDENYSSLQTSRSPKAPSKNKLPDSLIIGFIGSLNVQKGVKYLIKAFKNIRQKYPRVKLEILGDGPLRQELEQKVDKNISFLGTKKQIGKYLKNWLMIVVPSRSESFGQIVLEAAMFEKPAIASKVGGLPEVVLNGKTGILLTYGKTKELQRAIEGLLKDPEKAREMGRKARERYLKYFTAEKMIKKIGKVYQGLMITKLRPRLLRGGRKRTSEVARGQGYE